ncbi:MAG: M14 family zinc carboxypeptidase, partial [Candidatus Promineifilaceae bacterium]
MKRVTLFSMLLVALSGLVLGLAITEAPAAEGPDFDTDFVVVRAYFDDDAMLAPVTAWQEPWEIDRDEGYIVLSATPSEYEWLLSLGYRLEIDHKLTARYNQPSEMLPGQLDGIPGYPCYRTVEETFASAEAIVLRYPQLATWIDAGDSWEKVTSGGLPGYDIMVLRLTNEAIPGPKPKLFVSTSVHAREYTPPELSTRFAEYLVNNYGVDADATWLVDHLEIHLMLYVNPDGRKQAETGLSWRKNTNENYCSPTSTSRGADLNRNFEFSWNICPAYAGCSSGSECSSTYRGPSPASEPETDTVQEYVRSIFPDQRDDPLNAAAPITATGVFLDIHSSGDWVLWPWGFVPEQPPPNSDGLTTLGRKFAYFNDYYPTQATGLYPTDGTTDDFAYGDLGVVAYTFELGTTFSQSCGYFEEQIIPENMPALLYAAKVARTPYMTPSGPDSLDVTIWGGAVAEGTPVMVAATVDDTRFSSSNGTEPSHVIVAAEFYVDVPPWVTSTVPISVPMMPVDGAFDGTVEKVQATIDTTGLVTGQHIVYVRGQDSLGNWGALSSAFLYIIDPTVAPLIQGRVIATDTGLPLEAAIKTGLNFNVRTNQVTGEYTMRVISGTYIIRAEPTSTDYASGTIEGVAVHDYQTITQDFTLNPYCGVIEDDVESGNIGWTAMFPWAITDEESHSQTHSWTESPGSFYANNRNVTQTSQVLDLSDYWGVVLEYWQICDTEAGWDYCHVEVSTDGGATWEIVSSYDGSSTSWEEIKLQLPTVDHEAEVKIRYRFYSDGSEHDFDGWHIDDIRLFGEKASCVAETAPAAAFESSSPDPLGTTTIFTNTSTGGNLSFEWDYGDGSPLSSNANPGHLYALTGTYTVTLSVTNTLGTDAVSGVVE